MSLLQVTGTGKRIAATFALEDIHFSQQAGQNIGIAGATGSGKSTLLKIIAGLEDADTGIVYFETEKIKGPAYRLIPGQPGIAYLSQHYELRNHYRMEELLAYANTLPEGEAESLFALCRISHLLQRKTSQLSGGEKQRIALARLLLTAPRLLLLDEPFSNLDLIHKTILKKVLEDLAEQKGLTCIIASHDPQDLLSWAHELLILKEGKLLQRGSPEMIYHHPGTEYTGALLGKYNLLSPDLAAALDLPPVPEGKQQLIRPEHVKWAPGKNKGLKAIVQKISFWGSDYEAEVTIDDKVLLLKTGEVRFKPGQPIYIGVKEHDYCYL